MRSAKIHVLVHVARMPSVMSSVIQFLVLVHHHTLEMHLFNVFCKKMNQSIHANRHHVDRTLSAVNAMASDRVDVSMIISEIRTKAAVPNVF